MYSSGLGGHNKHTCNTLPGTEVLQTDGQQGAFWPETPVYFGPREVLAWFLNGRPSIALCGLKFVVLYSYSLFTFGNLCIVGDVYPAKEVGLSLEQLSVVLVPWSRLSAYFVLKDVWFSRKKAGMVLESVVETCWRSLADVWGGFCAKVLSGHSEARCVSTTDGVSAGRDPLGLLEVGCHWGLGHGKGNSVSEWSRASVTTVSQRSVIECRTPQRGDRVRACVKLEGQFQEHGSGMKKLTSSEEKGDARACSVLCSVCLYPTLYSLDILIHCWVFNLRTLCAGAWPGYQSITDEELYV